MFYTRIDRLVTILATCVATLGIVSGCDQIGFEIGSKSEEAIKSSSEPSDTQETTALAEIEPREIEADEIAPPQAGAEVVGAEVDLNNISPPSFPADQFDNLMYTPTQSGGGGSSDDNYESILQRIISANFAPLWELDESAPPRVLSQPVGLLKVLKDNNRYITCTASVLDENKILTNWHCLPKHEGAVVRAVLQMGFYRAESSEGVEKYAVYLEPIETSRKLDYAVLQVDGDLSEWGHIRLSPIVPSPRQPLTIIHHPQGLPKQITQKRCATFSPTVRDGVFRHLCDTEGGSSGAPVFYNAGSAGQLVVALHYAGVPRSLAEFDASTAFNRAIPMGAILEQSELLKEISSTQITEFEADEALSEIQSLVDGPQLVESHESDSDQADTEMPPLSNKNQNQIDFLEAKRLYAAESFDEAWTLMNKVCDLGVDLACGHVAIMTGEGRGTTKNEYFARGALDKICYETKDPDICFYLYYMKYTGLGGAVDDEYASSDFGSVCEAGIQRACTYQALSYLRHSLERRSQGYSQRSVTSIYKDSFDDFEKLCQKSDALACAYLGDFFMYGRGVSRNLERARSLYEISCAGKMNCGELGSMLYKGQGGSVDQERGLKLARLGCKRYNSEVGCKVPGASDDN